MTTPPALLPSLLASDRAPAPRTLVDIFMGVVAEHPDAPAVDSGQEMLTYAELAEAATALAESLAELGIGPGDLSLIHISEPTRRHHVSRMPSSA